ncbi:MAG: DUF4838 domain-containing protein [Clostridia bacterium]|nr:DUF4838 domain-containing protein [Clostridia bacterium]
MKWYKKLSLMLAGVLCFSTVGCAANYDAGMLGAGFTPTRSDSESYKGANGSTSSTGSVDPVTQHKVANTLHKVNVTETSKPFIVDGKTDYKIVIAGDCSEGMTTHQNKAAIFIRKHIKEVTGATVQIISPQTNGYEDLTWTPDSKYIVLDHNAMFAAAGLTMPTEDIGPTGYYIKSKGNSVFMMCNTALGYGKACLAFLREQLGFEQFAADCIVYDRADKQATLLDFNIIERPDFDYNLRSNQTTSEANYGMGFVSSGEIFITVGGSNCQYDRTYYLDGGVLKEDTSRPALTRTDTYAESWHNSHNYHPIVDYGSAHPKWFASYNDTSVSFEGVRGETFNKYEQTCYTAHGDSGEYKKLYEHIASTMITLFEANPSVNGISYSEEDNTSYCKCSSCASKISSYNGKRSGTYVELLNKADEIVQAYFQKKADETGKPKRDITILFFAYHDSTDPPLNSGGNPIITCRENVGPYIAPIRAAYDESFYNTVNKQYADGIKGWGKCSTRLYMWLYETDYHAYLFPLNSWDTMLETYRFCKNNNAMMMFPEGQFNQGAVTHFSRIKEYFNSKAHFDLNINFEEMLDRYFEVYFREAAPAMRRFFDELQATMRYLERKYPALNGTIYVNLEDAKYWPYGKLMGWMDLIDQAYAAIAHYEATDAKTYKMLSDHIKLESIFPRFALIQLYLSNFSNDEQYEMRKSFVEDCTGFGIAKYKETVNIDGIFNGWNVI